MFNRQSSANTGFTQTSIKAGDARRTASAINISVLTMRINIANINHELCVFSKATAIYLVHTKNSLTITLLQDRINSLIFVSLD